MNPVFQCMQKLTDTFAESFKFSLTQSFAVSLFVCNKTPCGRPPLSVRQNICTDVRKDSALCILGLYKASLTQFRGLVEMFSLSEVILVG